MGHAAVGIPVLDDAIDRQVFQETIDIEHGFEICFPGFGIRRPGVVMQSIEKGEYVGPVLVILIRLLFEIFFAERSFDKGRAAVFRLIKITIVTGELGEDGIFYADELLLKCPSKYEEASPEPVEES